MTGSESAARPAMHDESAVEGSHVQAWRARTRDSVASADTDPLTLTERNQQRIAERWGKRIEEPADDTPDEDAETFGLRQLLRGLTVHLHVYRDPIPSMRAVRADYKTGLEDAKQQSASAVILYRAFGLPGQAWAMSLRFLAVQGDRPGRFAGFLTIVVLFTGSLAWALLL